MAINQNQSLEKLSDTPVSISESFDINAEEAWDREYMFDFLKDFAFDFCETYSYDVFDLEDKIAAEFWCLDTTRWRNISFDGWIISIEGESGVEIEKISLYKLTGILSFWEKEHMRIDITHNLEALEKKSEIARGGLDAMEYIFTRNQSQGWYLSEQWVLWVDTYNFVLWEWGSEMNMLDVYELTQSQMSEIFDLKKQILWSQVRLWNDLWLWQELSTHLQELEDRYMNYIYGIWDKYEWWAKLFEKSGKELKYLVESKVFSFASPQEALKYYKSLHLEIWSNKGKSETNNRVNEIFLLEVNDVMFRYLLSRDASDVEWLYFAGLCSGRNYQEYLKWSIVSHERDLDMDIDMRDVTMANKVLTFISTREWWIFDRLQKLDQVQFEDSEMDWKTPKMVFASLAESISEQVTKDWSYIDGQEYINMTLMKSGHIHLLWSDSSYEELSFDDQITLSLLNSIDQGLRFKRVRVNQYWVPVWWNSIENGKMRIDEFKWFIWDIHNKFWKKLAKKISKSVDAFSWGVFDLNGFTWEELMSILDEDGESQFTYLDANILNLFNDINGNGMSNFSDGTIDLWKVGLVLWATIVWAMALTAITLWGVGVVLWASALASNVVLQWAVMWGYASLISMGLDPRGHDSTNEMLLDYGWDIWLGILTWAIWGWIASKWWDTWAKMFQSKKNTAIFAGDVSVLWFWTESQRMKVMYNIYSAENPFKGDVNKENEK